jgi:predicted DNA-binding WGR domain protein
LERAGRGEIRGMDTRSPVQHALVLHRIEPDRGVARFYSLIIERDLFGTIRLVRSWGRIGNNGQELVEVFADELEAGEALEAIARAKRRRGYRDLYGG